MTTASVETEALYEDATRTAPSAAPAPVKATRAPLSRIRAATETLDGLLNASLPALHEAVIALEERRLAVPRMDGRIIGTGEADFTKGNTVYQLNHKGKTFQLLDVPGIEGDENRYAKMVEEAVAKAHLVVYVNGTNKKPEKATAEKIRSYLRWGTRVYPLVNVRGNADAYEFGTDRESLESHGGALDALKQTVGVLDAVLPEGVLLPGNCVQGLIGFASLAVNSANGRTTIHPLRDKDLVIQQRNYRKYFASYKAMFEFSQLDVIAKLVDAKLPTFRDDIVESNKVKVRQLLAANIAELQTALADHQRFVNDVSGSFKDCRDLVEISLSTFERLLANGFSNRWSDLFNALSERADTIVANNYGENEVIASELKRASAALQIKVGEDIQKHLQALLEELQERARDAMQRLIVDVQRMQFLQGMKLEAGGRAAAFRIEQLDMSLSLKEWGGIALNIASYAATGATIGSAFPVIGTLIGGIAGAAIGALMSVAGFFTGKEKRIRKAQAQVQNKIEDLRSEVMGRLSGEVAKIAGPIRKEIANSVLAQVDALHAKLVRPLAVIEQQIAAMSNIKTQLEHMPYGTIQAIQR
jgi:gas vesicle protein